MAEPLIEGMTLQWYDPLVSSLPQYFLYVFEKSSADYIDLKTYMRAMEDYSDLRHRCYPRDTIIGPPSVSSLARLAIPRVGFPDDLEFPNGDSFCAMLLREDRVQLDCKLVRWSQRRGGVETYKSVCNKYAGRKDREGGMTCAAALAPNPHQVGNVYTLF
jgi:hypothetical protein